MAISLSDTKVLSDRSHTSRSDESFRVSDAMRIRAPLKSVKSNCIPAEPIRYRFTYRSNRDLARHDMRSKKIQPWNSARVKIKPLNTVIQVNTKRFLKSYETAPMVGPFFPNPFSPWTHKHHHLTSKGKATPIGWKKVCVSVGPSEANAGKTQQWKQANAKPCKSKTPSCSPGQFGKTSTATG